jgi:hypothetical protein
MLLVLVPATLELEIPDAFPVGVMAEDMPKAVPLVEPLIEEVPTPPVIDPPLLELPTPEEDPESTLS